MSGWIGGWTNGWAGSGAAAAPVSGMEIVADRAEMDAYAADPGTLVYNEALDRVYQRVDMGSFNLWLPLQMLLKADGTQYTPVVAQDVDGNDLHVYGGMTVPGSWPQIGTYTVNADHVVFDGVVYPNSASTAEKFILVLDMYDVPPAGAAGSAIAGCLGGSVRGGTSRVTGVRFTDGGTVPYPIDIGHYSASTTSLGAATYAAGDVLEVLADMRSDDGVTYLLSGSRGPGPATKRSLLLSGTRFFEVGALNASAAPVSGFKVRRAIQIDLT
jgi:hypothetical protein